MDNNQNLQYHLSNINIFNSKNVDIDIEKINLDKTIYNIYNNSINEPFHNFWFLVDNCKFLKSYDNKNNSYSLVFALNNKYEKHNKILLYIKQLLNYIKNTCLEKYKDIDYILPWIENDNFPVSICYQYDSESLFVNYETSNMDINTLTFNNNNNYTILFEIKYFTIKNNKIKLILFIKLIQLEKQFDLKNSLIVLLSPVKPIIEKNNLIETSDPIIRTKKEENIISNKPVMRISSNMLLEKLNQLKNKSLVKTNETCEEDNKNLKAELYIEEKNQLKKTIVNPNKDPYTIMKNNYLQDRGIIIDDDKKNNTETKIKKKKLVKIKKKTNIT